MLNIPSRNTSFNPEEKTRSLYRNWREGFVTPLLVGSLVFGLIALIPAVSVAFSSVISIIFIATYVIIGIVAFIPFPYAVRMGAFLLIIYVLGVSELATHGILGDGLFFFLGLVIFATMMFSPRAGVISMAANLLTFVLFGWLMLTDRFIPINPNAVPATVEDWISAGAVIVMFGIIIVLGFQRLETEFLDAQKQIDTTLSQLTDERNNLEDKVLDRTSQLRRVNDIGRAVTAILNQDELLTAAAFLIGREFESYYAAIYFIDITGQWAELREGTGDAGKVLRENKHKVDLGGRTAIAAAIRTKQIRIALDSGTESVRFDNPLLPYTRSQIVMPLVVGDHVIGALELHSTKESAFSVQDVDTYYNMANQVAIALENSRLFQEAQQSLVEMQATQRQYLLGAWSSLVAEKPLEYELGDDESAERQLEIPLTLRDQIIGQISMTTNDEWTPEQRSLIESIATQAALALENARLVEESQSIATREKVANEIISKVWASNTIDAILQTTVRELGRAMEAAEVDIEVKMGGAYE
jgi:GAF domain-containing protein